MTTSANLAADQRLNEALAAPDGGGRFGEWVRNHDESWLFVAIYIGLAVGLSVFVSLFWLVVVGVFHLALEILRQAYFRETRTSTVLHALWEIKMDVGLILLALTLVLYLEVVLGLLGLQSAARAAAATRVAQAGARGGTRAAHAGSRAAQAGSRAAQAGSRAAQAAARSGSRAGATGSAIEQWVRGFLLAVDEMARVAYATLVVRKKKDDQGVDPGQEATEDAERANEVVDVPAEAPHPAVAAPDPRPSVAWRGRWGVADHIGLVMVAIGIILILLAPYVTPHEWGTAVATLIDELRPLGPLGSGH
jgi:hypothetical protein